MTNHEITGKQVQGIFVLFWFSSSIISGVSSEAKQDSWLSFLISVLAILPLIALYIRLNKLYPGLNFYDVIIKIFGGVVGRILALIYIFYFVHLGSLVLRVFSQFVRVLGMVETPAFMTGTFIILIGIWASKNGPECIGRLSKFILPIVLADVVITFIISIKSMNFSYLKPVMETDLKSLLSGAFGFLMLPFGEIITCFSFLACINTRTNASKIYLKSLLLFSAVMLVIIFRNILVLGIPASLLYYYPSYHAVSILSLGDFFTRIEVLIGMNLMLSGFIKITVCLYSASLGITKVLNIRDQKGVIAPTGLLIITLADNAFKNVSDQFAWVRIDTFYAIPFQIILPLIIWVAAEIKEKMKSAGDQATGLDSSE